MKVFGFQPALGICSRFMMWLWACGDKAASPGLSSYGLVTHLLTGSVIYHPVLCKAHSLLHNAVIRLVKYHSHPPIAETVDYDLSQYEFNSVYTESSTCIGGNLFMLGTAYRYWCANCHGDYDKKNLWTILTPGSRAKLQLWFRFGLKSRNCTGCIDASGCHALCWSPLPRRT